MPAWKNCDQLNQARKSVAEPWTSRCCLACGSPRFSPKVVIEIIQEGIAKGGKNMSSYVLSFQDIDKTKLMIVGGKGANLGELSRIEGIRVPDGFCISTEAYKRIIGVWSSISELLAQLSLL